MAAQFASVTLTAADTGTFTFNKPTGTYAKNYGLTLTAAGEPGTVNFLADVDNGDGTMTGSVNVSGLVTGVVAITIYDTP